MARASRAWLQTPPRPEWHRAKNTRSDARPLPPEERARMRAFPRIFDGTCYWCGVPFDPSWPHLRRTREHIRPRIYGGGNDASNIAYSHASCNALRGHDTSWVPFSIHGRIGVRVPYDDRGRYDAPRKD